MIVECGLNDVEQDFLDKVHEAMKSSPEAVTNKEVFVVCVPQRKDEKHVLMPSGGRTRKLRWAS